MRKVAGVLVVAALMLPAGMMVSDAGAAGGTVCAKTSGKATFAPPLPVLTSAALVKGTLKADGVLGLCKGGGVTTAHTTFATKKSTTGSNCKTLATYDPKSKGTTGVFTIKWNTGGTTTVAALTLKAIKGRPATEQTVAGTVSAGLFKGSKLSGKFKYSLPAGACGTKPLSTVTYAQLTAITIK